MMEGAITSVPAGYPDQAPVLLRVLRDVAGGVGPPLGYPDQTRVDERETLEQVLDLIPAAHDPLRGDPAVVHAGRRVRHLRPGLPAGMADDQVAAGHQG